MDGRSVLSWDEAVEYEVPLPALDVRPVLAGDGPERLRGHLEIPGAVEIEPLVDRGGAAVGRIVRRRWPLRADVAVSARLDDGFVQVSIGVHNVCSREMHAKEDAIRASLIGTHALVLAEGAEFVSLLDPPPEAVAAAGRCTHHRCHPVLAGPSGSSDVLLGSPIMLYDHPEFAPPNPRTAIVSDGDDSGDVRLYRKARIHVSARVLVAGIGNYFRGDDGFGPEVVRRLAASGRLPEHVRAVDYGIHRMHLAYDLLDPYDALVIVEVVSGDGNPGTVTVLEVGEEDLGAADLDPHGMAPVAVLASIHTLGGQLPPTYVVGCRPGDVGDRIGLTTEVEAAIPAAMKTVLALLRNCVPEPAESPVREWSG